MNYPGMSPKTAILACAYLIASSSLSYAAKSDDFVYFDQLPRELQIEVLGFGDYKQMTKMLRVSSEINSLSKEPGLKKLKQLAKLADEYLDYEDSELPRAILTAIADRKNSVEKTQRIHVLLKILRAKNIDYTQPDFLSRENGQTGSQLAHYAAGACDFKTLKLLFEYGVDFKATDKSGITPIFYGIWEKKTSLKSLAFLARNSGNLELRVAGKTPLLTAAWRGEYKRVKVLAENGADHNALDDDGKTAFELANPEGAGK